MANSGCVVNGCPADGGSLLQSVLGKHCNLFNVAHFNASSINPATQQLKLDEIRSILRHKLLCVVGVTETWLKGKSGARGSTDKSICVKGYRVFRGDRMSPTAGGGVALYIKKGIAAKIVARSDGGAIEYLFVELMSCGMRVLVGVVYRPPTSDSINTLGPLFSTLSASYKNIFIMGDFNHDMLIAAKRRMVDTFFNSFDLHVVHNNFSPTNFTPNKKDTLVDYFVVSNPHLLKKSGQFWIPSISHHAFIYISLDIFLQKTSQSFEYRDYTTACTVDWGAIINDADFDAIYTNEDPDLQLDVFLLRLCWNCLTRMYLYVK